jgi:hypothetical protein
LQLSCVEEDSELARKQIAIPGARGWMKVKNPNYWGRDAEREGMQRSRERRPRTRV